MNDPVNPAEIHLKRKPGRPPGVKNKNTIAKERKLIRALIAGENITNAACQAGFGGTKQSARTQATKALARPHVREAFEKALDRAGLSIDSLAKEFRDGLERGKKGSHFDYLKLACKVRGLDTDDAAQAQAPTVGVLVNIVRDSAQARGLPL